MYKVWKMLFFRNKLGCDLSILLSRVLVGLFFLWTGYDKLFTVEGRHRMLETIIASGLPFPETSTLLASLTEWLGGALLALGLLTRSAALGLSCVMVVAIITNYSPVPEISGLKRTIYHFVYLPEFLYLLIFIFVMSYGAGTFSLDMVLKNNFDRNSLD